MKNISKIAIFLLSSGIFSLAYALEKTPKAKEAPKSAQAAKTMVWQADPNHSSVNFMVKHLGISEVVGHFSSYQGSFDFDPKNPQAAKFTFSVEVASLETGVEKRNNHVKSADFLDAEKYPKITFTSTKVEAQSEPKKYSVWGKLTIHGVEKEVQLALETSDTVVNPMDPSLTMLGMRFDLTLIRGDYQVGSGSWVADSIVGKEVKIWVLLELHKK